MPYWILVADIFMIQTWSFQWNIVWERLLCSVRYTNIQVAYMTRSYESLKSNSQCPFPSRHLNASRTKAADFKLYNVLGVCRLTMKFSYTKPTKLLEVFVLQDA